MKKKQWKRDCPKCGEEITYTNKSNFLRAEKKESVCKRCSQLDKKMSKESIIKMSKSHLGSKLSKEHKQKISISLKKTLKLDDMKEMKRNVMKKLVEETDYSDKMSKSIKEKYKDETWKKKRDDSLRKIVQSESHRKKQRLSTIKRIEKNKLDGNQFYPNHNPVGCEIIRWFNMYYGFNFQHAENGGEKCIDGYYPDGIDEKRKTIIEIDEPRHFNPDGTLKSKDVRRQNYLGKLGYKFIRIKFNG